MRNAQPWTRMAFPFAPYEDKAAAPLVKPLVRDGAPGYVGFGFSRPQDFPHSSGSTSNNTEFLRGPHLRSASPPSTPIVTTRRSLVAKGELPGMVHLAAPAGPSSSLAFGDISPVDPPRIVDLARVYFKATTPTRMTPEASEKLERKIREAAQNLPKMKVEVPIRNVGDKASRDLRAVERDARRAGPSYQRTNKNGPLQ